MMDSVSRFIAFQYDVPDLPLSKINLIFLRNLETYLKTERGNKAVTSNKVLQKLKSVIKLAIDNGWMVANPFPGHRFKHDRIEVVYLTVEELEHLEHHVFAQYRLSRVRDIFLFSVFTGLHYIDAMSLTDNNIVKGVDGKEWIKYLRQKNDKNIYIPLLSKAKYLIEKFREENGHSQV
jgi:integrase/recombinase XerD